MPPSKQEAPTAAELIASPDFRLKWVEKEAEILEDKIKFFDEISFKIKGWAITIWSALTTYAVTEKDWRISAIAGLVPILFLVVDASYKRYQGCFIDRSRDIMKLLNSSGNPPSTGTPGTHPFAIYDLLGIHGRGRVETSLDRQWGPIVRLCSKASVGLVYWALVLISLVILFSLSPSDP